MAQNNNTYYSRFALIDVLRGVAIALMFVYHFSWDLNNFKFLVIDFFHDPFWLHFRTIIVSLFLLVMGASLYLAHQKDINRKKFLRRLLWLVGCAALITMATFLSSGERFIYFGILHFIALASVLALPFVKLYWSNLVLAAIVIIAGTQLHDPTFNPRYLNWIGLASEKPLTDDYVPLFPWFGVVLLGIFLARWVFAERKFTFVSEWRGQHPLARLLRYAGRYSLLIYMLHQPIFIGILYTVSNFRA